MILALAQFHGADSMLAQLPREGLNALSLQPTCPCLAWQ